MSIIKKTNRKNKTNLSLKFNEGFFTQKELFASNPNFFMITLRSHVKKALEEKKLVEIGCIHNGKGRPQLVFTTGPVKKDVLDSARSAGVLLNSLYDSVPIINVSVSDTDVETNKSGAKVDSSINNTKLVSV